MTTTVNLHHVNPEVKTPGPVGNSSSIGNMTLSELSEGGLSVSLPVKDGRVICSASHGSTTTSEYSIKIQQSSNRLVLEMVPKKACYDIMNEYWASIQEIVKKGYKNPTELPLFGKSNRNKEVLETSAAVYHLFRYIERRAGKSVSVESKSESPELKLQKEKLARDFLNDRRVRCIVVGDGIGPACGYLLAGTTNWHVVSIDPCMNKDWLVHGEMTNLVCIDKKVEDVELNCDDWLCTVVVSVHGHANVDALWNKLDGKCNILLSIPCCKGFNQKVLTSEPKLHIREPQIPSKHNHIYIWEKMK